MSISEVGGYSLANDFYQNRTDNNESGKKSLLTNKKIHLSDQVELSREGIDKSRQSSSVSGISSFSKADVEAHLKSLVLRDPMQIMNEKASVLKGFREEKGNYDYSDIVNATGYAYAKCYAEIEKKYEENPDGYINPDGTKCTKEQEITWLDEMYEQAVSWDTTNARIAAEREKFKGNIDIIQDKDLEDYKESYSASRTQHMNQYEEDKENFIFHNFSFKQSWLMGKLYDLGCTQIHE